MSDDNEPVYAQCSYPGCPKTVLTRPHFFAPPRGWTWIEHGDPRYKDGLYCNEHAEEIEQRFPVPL
jgi:hypothetical protein